MLNINGIVEAVKNREKSYALLVNKEWYSGWGQTEASKGDMVDLEFIETKKDGQVWKNIKNIKVTPNVNSPVVLRGNPGESKLTRKEAVMILSYAKDIKVGGDKRTIKEIFEELSEVVNG